MATLRVKTQTGEWQSLNVLKGDTGPQGAPGPAPTIGATVTTLPAGSAATVTKSGSDEAPIFKFGIPKGDKGVGVHVGTSAPTDDSGIWVNPEGAYTFKAPVVSINGVTADSSGNIELDVASGSGVHVGTGAPEDSDTSVWIDTDEQADSVVFSVNGITPDANGNVEIDSVNTSGNRGQLAGYEVPAVTRSAVTINQNSTDVTQVTGAVVVTISNGSSNTAWTKIVSLTNASATISLGSSWKWQGGEVPTVSANSLLALHWCNTFGIANLIASE